MTRMWLVRLVAPVMIGALFLTGCGGGEETTSAASVADGSTDGSTDGGGTGVFDAAECADAVVAWSSAAAAAGAAMTAGAGDMGTSLDQLQAFAAAAPEEIRDDLTLVYEAYGEFLTALEDAGYDPTSGSLPTEEQLAAMEAASQALDDSEVQAASDRVSAWFESNCST